MLIERFTHWPAFAVSLVALASMAPGCDLVTGPGDPADLVATVEIVPTSHRFVSLDDTLRFTARILDAAGEEVNGVAAAWRSTDSTVVGVADTGLATAKSNGAASVIASAGRASDTVRLTVSQVAVTFKLSPDSASILLGGTARFAVSAADATGHAIPVEALSWSSADSSIASIDPTGTVAARAAGHTVIRVRYGATSAEAAVSVRVHYRLYGVAFGPFTGGQDPNRGATVTAEQIEARLRLIEPYTEWIRVFGSTGGLENTGAIAHRLGLKVACGAWLDRNGATNDREIDALIAGIGRGDCDIAIVGSETLLRSDLAPAQLISYIDRVRQSAAGVPVATADIYYRLWDNPQVLAAVDLVFANYYPFWDGAALDQAAAFIHGLHARTVTRANGKPVWVSETGWPSCGNVVEAAVPTSPNAGQYFLNFVSWARATDVPYFYFEAYDEPWKAAYEGPSGACWGVLDRDGHLKPDNTPVFFGQSVPDNWSQPIVPGGPGQPEIRFTRVPQLGSQDNLRGEALHVQTFDHAVAVYIKVRGRWWTKPYFAQPATVIRPDGSWTCDITTGGVDSEATEIAAFLIPRDQAPPLVGGGVSLPAELSQLAVAQVTVTR